MKGNETKAECGIRGRRLGKRGMTRHLEACLRDGPAPGPAHQNERPSGWDIIKR